jgi:hypothetical protein
VPNKRSKPATRPTQHAKKNAQEQQRPVQKQLQQQQLQQQEVTLHKQQKRRPVTSSSTPALELPAAHLLQYERKGYLVTHQLLDATMLQQLKANVQQHTQDHMLAALKQR